MSKNDFEMVAHIPVWAPGPLRYDADCRTKPGYWCIHPLENGNGPCGGNVYELDELSESLHYCEARKDRGR